MNTAAIRQNTDWVGQVVDGKFTLLQWLGNSGQGDVFLTELQGPARQKAAIRLIPANAPYSELQMAGWSAARKLSHPHLMRLIHFGQCHINGTKLFYAVTEYAEENLSQILPARALTLQETREMLDPLLDALGYVHEEGLSHGHLKPSNIMAVSDQLKLSSDNIQIAGNGAKSPTTLTVYDAPERAAKGTSPATDIWSLGITLVEALTQTPPAWDRSKQKVPLIPESMPRPFADIARDCLQTDPALRCKVSDIKARLRPTTPIAGSSSGAVRTVDPVKAVPKADPVLKKVLSTRIRMAGVLAAVLVLIVAVAVFTLRSRPTSPSSATETQQTVPATETPTPPAQAPQSSASVGSVKGEVASQVLPDVPPTASASIHGTVKVRVKASVDSGGNVSDATLESAGPSKYFSALALQAARQWKFKPPQVNDKRVSSLWILQFEFRQTGTRITPLETSPAL